MTKIIKPLFFLFVTLLIFFLIFQKLDYNSLKVILLNANFFYLIIGLLIVLLVPVFAAKKWQAVLKAMDYSFSWKESLKIIMAAYPISIATPARSGDLIRAYYLKDKIRPAYTFGAVVAERLIDIFVLAFYSFLGAVIIKNGLIFAINLSIILLIPLFFLIVNKIKPSLGKWQERIENFLYISKIFIRQPRKLLLILLYDLILWLMPIFEAKILFLALGADISLLYILAFFPLAIFISLIPITIAGMGTRDTAIIYLFSPWANPSVCLGVGLLYSFFAYWFLALLGLPLMRALLWKK